jgi:hypothetical protein
LIRHRNDLSEDRIYTNEGAWHVFFVTQTLSPARSFICRSDRLERLSNEALSGGMYNLLDIDVSKERIEL